MELGADPSIQMHSIVAILFRQPHSSRSSPASVKQRSPQNASRAESPGGTHGHVERCHGAPCLNQAALEGVPRANIERYRGTSLIRNCPPLGPCSRTMPRALCWPQGGGLFLMNEVPLYMAVAVVARKVSFWWGPHNPGCPPASVPRRACLSRGGPVCPEAGLSVPGFWIPEGSWGGGVLSSELGTNKTVKAMVWLWFSA